MLAVSTKLASWFWEWSFTTFLYGICTISSGKLDGITARRATDIHNNNIMKNDNHERLKIHPLLIHERCLLLQNIQQRNLGRRRCRQQHTKCRPKATRHTRPRQRGDVAKPTTNIFITAARHLFILLAMGNI